MKLDIQEILERFALIASLPMEEAVGYTALCSDAAGELTRRLRGTVSENNASRLEPAAASLAYYRYAMYQAANAEDFTVGDITVASGRDDKIRLAREVWMEAEREIADLLSDDGFVSAGCEYEKIRGSPQADKALRPECKTGDGGHRRDQERPGGDPASALPEQR